jgi:endonuclease/exonuclease/phosphatase family metal-dependent hydrolase
MTFNLEDVRTDDLQRPDHPRLLRAAAVIRRLQPDIVLLNEIAYDEPGVPGSVMEQAPGSNAQRFADRFIGLVDGSPDSAVTYRAFMAPSNTGISSGFDLNRDGTTVTSWPDPPAAGEDGAPAAQTAESRAYGDDSWGFGTFRGQYAMALLVRTDHEILVDSVRTFRDFPWSRLPGALRPMDPESGAPWYDDDVWSIFPLSSKSHWDVPVRTADGTVVHVLASHPTPPAFDGRERRHKLRNHDEIRFWAEYLDGSGEVVDDSGRVGGLAWDRSFVILGDLNADPDEGNAIDDPVGTWLLSHPRVNASFVPTADSMGRVAFPRLDPDDTARWGLRVDYVLPSADLRILDGAVDRPSDPDAPTVSDHFPVWIDVALPADPR